MRRIAIAFAALLIGGGAAAADTASVGPLTCSSAGRIEMQGCVTQQSGEGGTFGRCTIITTIGNTRITTRLTGALKPWGGVHPIRKLRRSLEVKYDPGKFTCRFIPTPEYVIGDCVQGPASGSCTVVKNVNGTNTYFRATASARRD